MARFVLLRGTVNHSSMFLSPECVPTGSPRVAIAIAILLCWFCTSSAFAEPGVVVGSYSKQSNAEAAAQTARDKLLNLGLDVTVRVIPTATAGAKASTAPARVVVLPRSGVGARALLRQVRARGFADAWYLAQTGASAATRTERAIAQRASSTAGVVTPTPALAQAKPAQQQNNSLPAVITRPRPSAGPQTVIGQEAGVDLHRLTIQTLAEADVDVVIDGKVDEALWQQFPYYDNMLVSIPALLTPAEYGTQMRLFATEKGLYVSSVMEQPPESLVKRYSRRDDFFDRDTFGVTIDASGEALVAYWFFVALGDSLSDGKVLPERRFRATGMVLGSANRPPPITAGAWNFSCLGR